MGKNAQSHEVALNSRAPLCQNSNKSYPIPGFESDGERTYVGLLPTVLSALPRSRFAPLADGINTSPRVIQAPPDERRFAEDSLPRPLGLD